MLEIVGWEGIWGEVWEVVVELFWWSILRGVGILGFCVFCGLELVFVFDDDVGFFLVCRLDLDFWIWLFLIFVVWEGFLKLFV